MATGDSVIRVSIIGDAKKLTGALKQADQSTGGLLKSTTKLAVGGLVGLGAVAAGFDFLKTSTEEADRLGDAMDRLRLQVGPGFTDQLEKTAGSFTNIGASTQDILELEAVFADFGTTAGIADDKIASTAEKVAALATALTLTDDQGRDASAMLDLITKAAGGSEKAARELGVTLLDNVDATTQLDNIMAQLNPKLVEATTGTGDLEQHQRAMQAATEDLSAKLGKELQPAFDAVLLFFLEVNDDIPETVKGFQDLAGNIVQFGRNVLGPLGNVRDVLEAIVHAFDSANGANLPRVTGGGSIGGGGTVSGRPRERDTVGNQRDHDTRNGVVRDKIGGP